MKKLCYIIILVGLACQIWAGGNSDKSAVHLPDTLTVTDCLDRKVQIPSGADEFVAVGPGCLRLYCYVGDPDKIIGIEQLEVTNGTAGRPYIKANPSLLELPVIGPGGPANSPDPEKILQAFPDVIFSLYNSDTSSVDELQRKTGIPVIALSYGNTEVFDPLLHQSIELLGQVTGEKTRATEVIRFFEACQSDLQKRTAYIPDENKPTVYLGAQSMRGTHGIESTSGNYSLFNAVNARNVLDEAGIDGYVMLDREKLLELDPDIIILDAAGLANVLDDFNVNEKFYLGLSAYKNRQVYMQLPYNYYYTNIDIALCDAYYIGSILYPEQFADIDIKEKADEIFETLLGKELYKQVADEYYGGFHNLVFSKE